MASKRSNAGSSHAIPSLENQTRPWLRPSSNPIPVATNPVGPETTPATAERASEPVSGAWVHVMGVGSDWVGAEVAVAVDGATSVVSAAEDEGGDVGTATDESEDVPRLGASGSSVRRLIARSPPTSNTTDAAAAIDSTRLRRGEPPGAGSRSGVGGVSSIISSRVRLRRGPSSASSSCSVIRGAPSGWTAHGAALTGPSRAGSSTVAICSYDRSSQNRRTTTARWRAGNAATRVHISSISGATWWRTGANGARRARSRRLRSWMLRLTTERCRYAVGLRISWSRPASPAKTSCTTSSPMERSRVIALARPRSRAACSR